MATFVRIYGNHSTAQTWKKHIDQEHMRTPFAVTLCTSYGKNPHAIVSSVIPLTSEQEQDINDTIQNCLDSAHRLFPVEFLKQEALGAEPPIFAELASAKLRA